MVGLLCRQGGAAQLAAQLLITVLCTPVTPGAPGVSSQLVVPDAGADGVGVAGVVGDGSVV